MRSRTTRRVGAIALALAIWIGAAGLATARDYESGFGFGISVPDAWLVLTRGEVEKHADLFLENEGSPCTRSVSPGMRQIVYDRVRRGELEIFYRQEGVFGGFVDNVNIMLQSAQLPGTPDQLKGLCRVLPSEFSRLFGRPIAMDGCEMRERAGRSALYLQFDGAIPGTTTLQYQLPQYGDATLVITATAEDTNLPRLLGEFEQIIASIRMH